MTNFLFHLVNLSPRIRCARLHLRRRNSTLFFTLTDLENRVISALSLGQVTTSNNRRQKCSLVNIDRLILKMRRVFRKYSINSLTILVRSSFSWQLRNLERLLAPEYQKQAWHRYEHKVPKYGTPERGWPNLNGIW